MYHHRITVKMILGLYSQYFVSINVDGVLNGGVIKFSSHRRLEVLTCQCSSAVSRRKLLLLILQLNKGTMIQLRSVER